MISSHPDNSTELENYMWNKKFLKDHTFDIMNVEMHICSNLLLAVSCPQEV